MSLILGIDLGTTNSCAAIYRSEMEIIPLDLSVSDKTRTLASFVLFDKGNILVGEQAERRSATKPSSGIFDSKRMIGRKYNDTFIQECKSKWPFTVKADSKGDCLIEIPTVKGEAPIHQTPQQISGEILKQIKNSAEKCLKQSVEEVVITVPAYFTDAQRRGTMEAADLAGLKVLELINEPTAAALAFSHQQDYQDRLVLVYDLGGGTFDISIVKFKKGEGEVIAKNGDSKLGGRDFDNNLVELILKKAGFNLDDNSLVGDGLRRTLRVLKTKSREVKEQLSLPGIKSVEIEFDLFSDIEKTVKVTREEFENLNLNLFKKTIDILNKTLNEEKITTKAIDDVVLVGGSTRIPKIRELLSDYFEGRDLSHGINPDEAVAMGAALRGATLGGNYGEVHTIKDIASFAFGVEIVTGGFSIVIPKGTKIPAKITRENYITVVDNQTEVNFPIYEGNDKIAKKNTKLGELLVSGLKPLPIGKVKIAVTFKIDSNGILEVTATESSNNRSNSCSCHIDYL